MIESKYYKHHNLIKILDHLRLGFSQSCVSATESYVWVNAVELIHINSTNWNISKKTFPVLLYSMETKVFLP